MLVAGGEGGGGVRVTGGLCLREFSVFCCSNDGGVHSSMVFK